MAITLVCAKRLIGLLGMLSLVDGQIYSTPTSTPLNHILRTLDRYIITPLSFELKGMQSCWNRLCGFSNTERSSWLLQFEVKEYNGPLLKDIQYSKYSETFKKELQSLLNYVENPTLSTASTSYLICGHKGIGKSGFVRALMHDIKRLNPVFRTFEIPCSELWSILTQETSIEGIMYRFQIHAPCFIFLKDISYLTDKVQWNYNDTVSLMRIFAHISKSNDYPVILCATPNKLEAIDTSVPTDIWNPKCMFFH
jgi:ATPase family associated with various cellular activities (AAA)